MSRSLIQFVISFFTGCLIFFAVVGGLEASEIIIDDTLDKKSIEKKVSYFIDRSGTLSIDDVSSKDYSSRFIKNTRKARSFGYDPSVFWIRIAITNPTGHDVPWVLEYGYTHMDSVALFIPEGKPSAARMFSVIQTGDRYPYSTRKMPYRKFSFPLAEKPGSAVYYLRLQTRGAVPLRLTAWKMESLHASIVREYIFFFVYYGLFLGLILYNIFIFFSVRDRSYVYLGVLLISYVLASMTQNGLAAQFLWPDAPVFANYAHPFAVILCGFLAVLFSRVFLNTREYLPLMDKILKGLIALYVAALAACFVTEYHFSTQLSVLISALNMLVLFVLSIVALFHGGRTARYYFFSWVFMIVSMFMLMLRTYGVIPDFVWITWLYHLSSALMVLLLSLGIADRMNIIRDERERALKSLKEADDKYKTLVESAHEGIIMVVDEIVVYVNKSMIKMTGFGEDDFLGHHLSEFLPDTPLGRELVLSRYRDRMAGLEIPPQYEAELLTEGGEVISVIVSASPIYSQGQKGIVATITDITDLKKAHEIITSQFHEIQSQCEEVEMVNEELKQAHTEMGRANESLSRETEKLSITLKSIGEGVITVDAEGSIDIMNRAAEKITGYTYDEARGRHISEILFIESSDGPVGLAGFNRDSFAGSRLFAADKDIVVIDKNGQKKFVLPIFSEVRDIRDTVIGAIFVLNDITQRKKMEDELFKSSKIESLGVFAGGIAHDFNNLLTAIVGNVSLVMLDMDKRDRHYKYLSDAEKMTGRAADLTRQLLTFSRGGAPVKKTACVRDLLSDTVEFVLSGSNVKAEFSLAPDLWNGNIDEGQISQVVQNLILNSVQAMPGGGTVHVSAENYLAAGNDPITGRGGEFIRIVIRDEGPGVPSENIAKIFDPFFTTKPGGNGLGLSICYSIIKKHDGNIALLPAGDGGAVFELMLPASRDELNPVARQAVEMKYSGRVLFMDDEKIILDVGERMLKRLGLHVETAFDGEAAIDRYKKSRDEGKPFDLIIMDLTIPGGMGGRDAIVRIREMDSDVKVVASSGYSNDPVMAHFEDYGFNAVIGKPYTLDQMADLVRRLLPGYNQGAISSR
ncbi:MAG TPA: 7TM diverse intracellular signaling domain-containing protein [Spirochaetota bacterium]|nr:7TM diverse intracellular signaling domain-containing protein [Spirochaetota bacterium]HPI89297.1 7TM diverse intracellular signaling domain-containing protein [Spirochaetota bacterium]HPR48534.1 7TM diverse intracellular signaling domain-containing protein [Spirochaetota bacterium]